MKRLLIALIFVVTFFPKEIFAQNDKVEADIVNFRTIINGEVYELKSSMLLINDHTYLPIREIALTLKLSIMWNEKEKTIKISNRGIKENIINEDIVYDTTRVEAELTDFSIAVDDKSIKTKNKIIVLNGTSYLPIRDIAEAFSMEVNWEGKTQTIFISYENEDRSAEEVYEENDDFLIPFQLNENDLWGYMDEKGNVIIEPQYTYADEFHDGMAVVAINGEAGWFEHTGQYGYINSMGVEVVPCIYDDALEFSEGLGAVMNWSNETNDFEYLDKNGNVIIEGECWELEPFHCGRAYIMLDDNKEGFIDINGNFTEISVNHYHDGFQHGYLVTDHKILNTDFELIFDGSEYEDIKAGEGFIIAKKNGKYGVVDYNNNIIIDFKYDNMFFTAFDNAFEIQYENSTGYVNINGNRMETLPPEFIDEIAVVKINDGKFKIIDSRHRVLAEINKSINYDYIKIYSKDVIRIYTKDGEGYNREYIDGKGNLIEPKGQARIH